MRIAAGIAVFVLCMALVWAGGCGDGGDLNTRQAIIGSWKVFKHIDRGRERTADSLVMSFRQDGTVSLSKTNRGKVEDLRWELASYGSTEFVCFLRVKKPDQVRDMYTVSFNDQGRELVLTEVRRNPPFKSTNDSHYLKRQ